MGKLPKYQIEQNGKWWIITCEDHEVPPFTQFASAEDAEEARERYEHEDLEDMETFCEEQNKL
jgi:hypothetical protein